MIWVDYVHSQQYVSVFFIMRYQNVKINLFFYQNTFNNMVFVGFIAWLFIKLLFLIMGIDGFSHMADDLFYKPKIWA